MTAFLAFGRPKTPKTLPQMDHAFYPAMAAALCGDLERFTEILDGAPRLAAARSSCGHPTLLQFVAVDGGLGKIPDPVAFARVLVARGAPLEEPLVAAASVGARDLVDCFVSSGASIEACAPWTPLEEAVYWAHRALAHYLWQECEAAVRSLRAAAGLGSVALAASYFDEGGSLRPEAGPVRFPWGERSGDPQDVLNQALVIAAKNGQVGTARLLLERGAEVNVVPPGIHERGAPLHLAALLGLEDMVALLLERGADRTLRDPEHDAMPSGWARHGGFDALARGLLEEKDT